MKAFVRLAKRSQRLPELLGGTITKRDKRMLVKYWLWIHTL